VYSDSARVTPTLVKVNNKSEVIRDHEIELEGRTLVKGETSKKVYNAQETCQKNDKDNCVLEASITIQVSTTKLIKYAIK